MHPCKCTRSMKQVSSPVPVNEKNVLVKFISREHRRQYERAELQGGR